jgi:hypothetical protein
MPLAAKADHGNDSVLDDGEISALLVEQLSHGNSSYEMVGSG